MLVSIAAQLHPIDSSKAGGGMEVVFSVYSGTKVWNRTVPTGVSFDKIDYSCHT